MGPELTDRFVDGGTMGFSLGVINWDRCLGVNVGFTPEKIHDAYFTLVKRKIPLEVELLGGPY